MKNPCYDIKTKTDCPDRKGGCNKDCEKWAKWCELRNKDYRRRLMVYLSSTEELERKHRRF